MIPWPCLREAILSVCTYIINYIIFNLTTSWIIMCQFMLDKLSMSLQALRKHKYNFWFILAGKKASKKSGQTKE